MKPSEKAIKRIEKDNEQLVKEISAKLNLKHYLKQGSKHLDFGCGFGNFTYFLAKKYPSINVTGIDKDCKRIKEAKARYKLSNLKFRCSSKIDRNYNSITAKFVLHHVLTFKSLLKELKII